MTLTASPTLRVPALLILRNGMKINIRTESQLRLVPDAVAFEYIGCQDGLAFYKEKAAA